MRLKTIFISFFLCSIYGLSHAAHCIFDLPPSEQLIIKGDQLALKTLHCEVETNGEESNHLLNFISESNTSVVNNLVLPEGTIMSLSFASLENDKLTFELKENARLGITNDSNEFIRLACD
jgi:hypothetical protein